MAISLFSSNRVEILQARLAQDLQRAVPEDPFASEVVVVPTFAMSRWLNLRLAQQHGIAANIYYPQPGEWVWRLAASVLGDLPRQDPYAPETMGWRLFALLPGLLECDGFELLGHFLADDASGIKRWQLSQRIALGFDRYQSYRPQLIRDWSNGNDNQWQAQLWRALLTETGACHRVEILSRLIERLGGNSPSSDLPKHCSLFALSTMPPLYLELLQALALHMELGLYLHSPSDQYWADLENAKRTFRRRLEKPAQRDLFTGDNELLASWGRQGQVFQDRLLDLSGAVSFDVELFEPPDENSLLGRLQGSIFRLESRPSLLQADDSVSVHVCHSPLRECQILLDQLLDMMERDPSLDPEDVLVMIPDIGAYAPHIEAVFRHSAIPCNISDVSLADEHPMVTAFLQLLNLPSSRFTFGEIFSLLDNEAIRQRFDIDTGALAAIRRQVELGRTRWGLDSGHKTELGLPATSGNTWQQLRERFFAGFALAGEDLWHGIAPLAAEDETSAAAMGRLWHFLERLQSWRGRLADSRKASEWPALVTQLLADFFAGYEDNDSRLQQVRDIATEVGAAGDSLVSPLLLTYLMQRLLKTRERSGQLYSGGVTFCGMRPMRSIPFRVICLLGMNRGDFPRRDPPADFELVSPGQDGEIPGRRTEDRYLMLETLLCARQKLFLSYTGRSLRDNSELQPSVLVQELLDYIDSCFEAGDSGLPPSASIVQVHPMQPFSAAAFSQPGFSYNSYWCSVARQLANGVESPPRRWPLQALARKEGEDESDSIDIAELRQFVADPVRYFFRRRLGIFLRDDNPDVDDEPFDLAGLDAWRVKQRLGEDRINGREDSVERLLAEGWLAHGQAAFAQVERAREESEAWLEALDTYCGIESRTSAFELELPGDVRLVGTLTGHYPGHGLMRYHGGRLKGRHLLALWIDHLALHASGLATGDAPGRLIAQDKSWSIPPVERTFAGEQLADYASLYRRGLELPLPVFPDISFIWARADNRERALSRAWSEWNNTYSRGGDKDNPYLKLLLGSGLVPPFEDPDFDAVSKRLYASLLALGDAK